MINIVYGGSDAFDAVVHGESHPNNLWLKTKLTQQYTDRNWSG
jgi:hypothetical protein